MNNHTGSIQTGNPDMDSLIQILLSTGMFVAGFTAFILDNTISGTDEERGLTGRHAAEAASKISRDTSYDLPIGMGLIKKMEIFKWIPISPTYQYHPVQLLRKWRTGDSADFGGSANGHLPQYSTRNNVEMHNSSSQTSDV